MRFMTLWRPGKNANPMSDKLNADMIKLVTDMQQAGVMVATGGWSPDSPCTVLRSSNAGKVTVADGPFPEAKEGIAGFAVLEVKSKDEALEWSKRFLKLVGEGTSELRPLDGPPAS